MFTNNKGGVGKTTSAFNIAKMFAKHGYKTVIVDLDPQCNISRLALGENFIQNNLFSNDNIFTVLEKLISGTGDINKEVNFLDISENLSILQGSLKLSNFERMLSTGFNEAAAGQTRGFVITSAIDRFLRFKGLNENVDLYIIDTNPSLSQLNKAIFLATDYFLVPNTPDVFNVQGVENLGSFFEEEKRNWNLTSAVLAKTNDEISPSHVLKGDSIFVGYILNSYNVSSKKPVSSQQKWIDILPQEIKEKLSLKQSKNGLVELSWSKPIGFIQDYGQLSTLSQESGKAIFEISESDASAIGTIENLEKSKEEFESIYVELLERISKW
ncbi:ParA family protein [Candidatus Gracilibacteria bacterium]|nr:ParA family protein [Candidatus Gracilibacteria bacterium]